MRRTISWLMLLLLLGLPTIGARAAEEEPADAPERPQRERPGRDRPKRERPEGRRPKREKKDKPRLHGAHAQMQKVCNLTEQQVARMVEINQKRKAAEKQWDAEHGQQLKAARARAAEARKGGDKQAAAEARKEVRKLQADRGQHAEAAQKEIMALLTDEQKAQWREYIVLRTVRGRLRGVELSEDQQTRLKEAIAAMTKDVDLDDRKARAAAYNTIYQYAFKEVLTDPQREQLKAPRPKRERGDKPAGEDGRRREGRNRENRRKPDRARPPAETEELDDAREADEGDDAAEEANEADEADEDVE
jgi:hypothetical protein